MGSGPFPETNARAIPLQTAIALDEAAYPVSRPQNVLKYDYAGNSLGLKNSMANSHPTKTTYKSSVVLDKDVDCQGSLVQTSKPGTGLPKERARRPSTTTARAIDMENCGFECAVQTHRFKYSEDRSGDLMGRHAHGNSVDGGRPSYDHLVDKNNGEKDTTIKNEKLRTNKEKGVRKQRAPHSHGLDCEDNEIVGNEKKDGDEIDYFLEEHEKERKEKKLGKGVRREEAMVKQESKEVDYVHRGQWLRAAILGANDGLVSIASLMMGVGAIQHGETKAMVVSGLAGLIGGACSMAIGEFISVYSQRDAELFDKQRHDYKQRALRGKAPQKEQLVDLEKGDFILVQPTSKALAKHEPTLLDHFHLNIVCGTLKTNDEYMKKNFEDNIQCPKEENKEKETSIGPSPWEASGISGLAFALGATIPLLSGGFIKRESYRISMMIGVCSISLLCMGAIGAKLSSGGIIKGSLRVLIGGWAAMLITFGLLRLFGTSGL